MLALKGLFNTNRFPDAQYVSSAIPVPPFAVVPQRLALGNMRLALVGEPWASTFATDVGLLHPALNGSTIGGVGFADPVLRSLYVPPLADVTLFFSSEDDLAAYVAAADYGSLSRPSVWSAVVFSSGPPAWDYALRFNASQVPDTNGLAVNTFITAYRSGPINRYAFTTVDSDACTQATARTGNPAACYSFPGFLTLQRVVDRWILNRRVPTSEFTPLALLATVASALDDAVPGGATRFEIEMEVLNSTDPAAFAAIYDDLRRWMEEEAFAPQELALIPFPVSSYSTNLFYTVVLFALTLLFVIGSTVPVSRLVRALVVEKEEKLREAMFVMGVPYSALYLSWFTTYTLIFGTIAVITAAIFTRVFPQSSPSIIFALFFFFGTATTTFCTFVSVFFSKAKTATVLGSVAFFSSYFVSFAALTPTATLPVLAGGSLLAPTALALAMDVLGSLESNGVGVTAITLPLAAGQSGLWSMANAISMLIFDTLLFAALTFYADAVLPAWLRDYGVPRPWYFVVTPSYWREVVGLQPVPVVVQARTAGTWGGFRPPSMLARALGFASNASDARAAGDDSQPDVSFVEAPDASLLAKAAANRTIELRALCREFSTPDGVKVAVDGLNLTMYEGQIFALLGQNGAGKTTTISMLTGLIPATSGGASLFGRDLETNLGAIRSDMGYCPQHDVLWPELTVAEHLRFFAAVKGLPVSEVEAAVDTALKMVGLTEKVNVQSSALSGGQKRKLSLSIAFMGGSRVVLLDEPTSGMDPYSRRSTWQILQNAREGRVIVLTTHFMDEADVLGDRIAIMADGKLRCCGSSMFLKKAFGVGYVLTLLRAPTCDVDRLLALIRQHEPAADVATNAGAELTLRLPLTAASAFPALLAELDTRLAQLGLLSYGLGVTSIEDCFLQVASGKQGGRAGGKQATAGPSDDNSMIVANPLSAAGKAPSYGSLAAKPTAPVRGSGLGADVLSARARARAERSELQAMGGHMWATLLKRGQYARRDVRAICCQLILPAIILISGISLLQANLLTTSADMPLSVDQFNRGGIVFGRGPRGTQVSNKPMFPNYVSTLVYKSAPDAVTAYPESATINALVASLPAEQASTDGGSLNLTATMAAALDATNEFGFITSGRYPTRDYERLSTFLLASKRQFAASKYGAFAFTRTGSLLADQDPQAVPPVGNAVTAAVFFNSTATHGGPIFTNLLTNALLRAAAGVPSDDTTTGVLTRSHPLPLTASEARDALSTQSFSVTQVLVVAFAFVPSSFILFVVKEAEVGAKHQQVISGLALPAYWLANWAFDCVSFVVPWALAIAVVKGYSIGTLTVMEDNRFPALLILLALYGPASASFCYLISHLFRSHSAAQAVMLLLNVVVFGVVITMFVLLQIGSTCDLVPRIVPALRLLPLFSLGNGLVNLSFLDTLSSFQLSCDVQNGRFLPDSSYPVLKNALDFGVTGGGIAYLAVEAFVYLALAIAVDYGRQSPQFVMALEARVVALQRAVGWTALCGVIGWGREEGDAVALSPAAIDEDVSAEAARVHAQVTAASPTTDVILLDGVRKTYASGKVAVRELSFGVPAGQVFGFLGINGAGKSTSLKILSGDVLPSHGRALLGGFDILREQMQVRRLLGYCPQFDALLDLLTPAEHLWLYARIKGMPEGSIPAAVAAQVAAFGLEKYANKLAGTLSGGNKRKLSVAISLIGGPPLVFLDEPSTGVDPLARRGMWTAISKAALEAGASIILTTHSMEEVEALCTRIGIMVGGRLRCLGSAQHLRDRHGRGFLLEARLAPASEAATAKVADSVLAAVGPFNAAAAAARQLPFDNLGVVGAALGNTARIAAEVTSTGTGWALAAAFDASRLPGRAVSVDDWASWWANEDASEAAVRHLTGAAAFPSARLVERQGPSLRFAIPTTAEGGARLSLGAMFSIVEGARPSLRIETYTIAQMTLESIFNGFAAGQEEEKGMARGMVGEEGASFRPVAAQVALARAADASGSSARAVKDWAAGRA